jgi:hypothetical protein
MTHKLCQLAVCSAASPRQSQERLQPREWAAAATAGVGVLLLGASSEPEAAATPTTPVAAHSAAAQQQHQRQQQQQPLGGAPPAGSNPAHLASASDTAGGGASSGLRDDVAHAALHAAPAPWRVMLGFLLLLAVLGLEVWWRQRRQQRKRRGTGHGHSHAHVRGSEEAADAAACGLEAGACFGFSAAACRTGFQLAPTMGWLLVPAGLAASVGLTSSGFILQVRGGRMRHGWPLPDPGARRMLRRAPAGSRLGVCTC